MPFDMVYLPPVSTAGNGRTIPRVVSTPLRRGKLATASQYRTSYSNHANTGHRNQFRPSRLRLNNRGPMAGFGQVPSCCSQLV
jgi:hypothetical protein